MKDPVQGKQKHKGAGLPLEADLHVTLPMQPEEVAARLLSMQSESLRIRLGEDDSGDQIDLYMDYWRNGKTHSVRIVGQLRRWQGTSTRFDCAGITLGLRWLSDWLVQGTLTLLIVAIVYAGLMAYYRDYWIVYDWDLMIRTWVLPPLVLSGIAAFFILREVLLKNLFRNRAEAAAVDLDRLMQRLADILATASAEETKTSLEDASEAILLMQQAHKGPR